MINKKTKVVRKHAKKGAESYCPKFKIIKGGEKNWFSEAIERMEEGKAPFKKK